MDMSNRRIVILGKAGVGKSSVANTIFGKKMVNVGNTFKSDTQKCKAVTKPVNGRNITLIDTPGFFDTDRSEKELRSEIVKCITECAPGPHAFLIVLKVDRYTEHEQDVINKIINFFSEEVLKYATVLFTHGDQLEKGKKIEDFVHDNDLLRDLMKKCGGRCHVVDNKYWKNKQQKEYRSNQFQVKELLKTIDEMVKANKGQCFMSDRRIVIMGKTGVGKSSLANTIFGEELFQIGHSVSSETNKCKSETKPVNGRNITFIDTPGFFNTILTEKELKSEILRCIIECAPGVHAVLIVLKVEKYTKQEEDVISIITKRFSEEFLKYVTVLFTHGDQLPKGKKIEDFVHDNDVLRDLVKKCGGRCHVIDNKYWKNKQQKEYRTNQFQVKELLKTIDEMVDENEGRCYTNEMLQAAEEKIKEEMQLIRQSAGNKSEEEIREEAKDRVFKRFLINSVGIATGVLLGALFGVGMLVGQVYNVLKKPGTAAAVAAVIETTTKVKSAAIAEGGTSAAIAIGGAVGGAVGGTAAAIAVGAAGIAIGAVVGATAAAGAIQGGLAGYDAAKEAETPGQAAKMAAESFMKDVRSVFKAQDNSAENQSESKPLISP